MNTETQEETKTKKTVNLREISTGRAEIFRIDPRKIEIKDGFNVRQDFGDDWKEFKASIRENGVLTPYQIFTEDGHIYIEDGHRRHKAVMELIEAGEDIKDVPCILMAKKPSEEQRVLGLLLYNTGKPLEPYEEAEVVRRLAAFGYTQAEIAKKTGKTQAWVSNMLILANVPKEVTNQIKAGKIASSTVLDITRQVGEKSEKLVEKVKEVISDAEKLGKKKATKKTMRRAKKDKADASAEPGETAQPPTPGDSSTKSIIRVLDLCINALQSDNEVQQMKAVDAAEALRASLVKS